MYSTSCTIIVVLLLFFMSCENDTENVGDIKVTQKQSRTLPIPDITHKDIQIKELKRIYGELTYLIDKLERSFGLTYEGHTALAILYQTQVLILNRVSE